MSKRSQTSGLPKSKSKPTADTESRAAKGKLSREYRSRAEREAQLQRRVVFGVTAAVVISVVVLAAFLIKDLLVDPNQVVASVDGQNITVAEFQQRVRLERFLLSQQISGIVDLYRNFGMTDEQINQQLLSQPPYSDWMSELQIPDQLGNRVVNDMVEDAIVRQKAAELGITVSQEDIDAARQDYFGFDPATAGMPPTPTITPTITPTPFVSPTPSPEPSATPTTEATAEVTPEVTSEATPEVEPTVTWTPLPTFTPTATLTADELVTQFQTNVDEYYDTIRSNTGLSSDVTDRYFERLALRKAVRDAVTVDDSDLTLQVNVRHILVATEEEAQDVIAALEAGESFSDLARSVSTDTGSGSQGGELGWSPITNYVKPFADAVREAEIGAIVGPVQSEFGYHIIQVRAREDREPEEGQLDSAKDRVFDNWLEEQRTAQADTIQIFNIWTSFVPR
jgi:parvulin-like peptidyl-prolyl isomerase